MDLEFCNQTQNPETDFRFEKSVPEVDFKKEIQIPFDWEFREQRSFFLLIMLKRAKPLFLGRVSQTPFGICPTPPPPPPLKKETNKLSKVRFLNVKIRLRFSRFIANRNI